MSHFLPAGKVRRLVNVAVLASPDTAFARNESAHEGRKASSRCYLSWSLRALAGTTSYDRSYLDSQTGVRTQETLGCLKNYERHARASTPTGTRMAPDASTRGPYQPPGRVLSCSTEATYPYGLRGPAFGRCHPCRANGTNLRSLTRRFGSDRAK